ncbi:hypothetical protein INR49_001153 [Caranx melampygus]|nr:hypothetical protein INR49_001153 [Caranx melampygus]
MTTEYSDNAEDDGSSFWSKEPRPVYFSGVSRFRRWLFPALTATVILILIIAVGASNTAMSSRLWFVETSVSNLTESRSSAYQLVKEAAKDVHRLKFAVESNKDQLSSASVSNGCCALGWELSGTTCYLFSKTPLSWEEARDWCNAHESHLVILNTDDEWDFVIHHAAGSFYWVGLSDERTGKWEWVNQTPYVMNRRRWKPGQPDSWTGHGLGAGDEDCAHMHSDGRLNDLHCSTRLRYICQTHSQRT